MYARRGPRGGLPINIQIYKYSNIGALLDRGGLPINIQIYKYSNIGALLDRGGLPRAWGPGDHQVGDCESSRQVSLQIIRLSSYSSLRIVKKLDDFESLKMFFDMP